MDLCCYQVVQTSGQRLLSVNHISNLSDVSRTIRRQSERARARARAREREFKEGERKRGGESEQHLRHGTEMDVSLLKVLPYLSALVAKPMLVSRFHSPHWEHPVLGLPS